MSRLKFLTLATLLVTGWHCNKKDHPDPVQFFESTPVAIDLKGEIPEEVSGMADSEINPGYCWVQQDSNNPPEIILLDHDGLVYKKIYLKGATNIDWEDITTGTLPGTNGKVLLIAETGNNSLSRSEFSIYRFPEPSISQDTINTYHQIRFIYPDGPHDAEALLSDINGDIYLITKRDTRSRIYKLPFPQQLTAVNTAQFLSELPYNGVVSATSSISGMEVIIKTYTELKYYARKSGQSLEECLRHIPSGLTYQLEPMGEAITFSSDGTGFYTLSEKSGPNPVKLYFYKRK
jgi:hypothetical protein